MKSIRIRYHAEPEGWWAESPDVPGFTAAGATLEDVRREVESGIPFFLGEPARIIEEDVPSKRK